MTSALLGWLAALGLISAAGTWIARRYSLGRDLLDEPGERRSHSVATPRGGGIAIALAMVVAILVLILRFPLHGVTLGLVLSGLLVVAGIGWVDDHRPLSPWLRLAVHGVAASLLALAVIVAGGGVLQAGAAWIAVIVLVNVWNFMDGIDGIATSQAALVTGFIALSSGGGLVAWLSSGLLAACLGFLPFNFPRAWIFLGDVGSGALGYLLAVLLALGYRLEPVSAWILLPLSAFLLDATLTLFQRIVRGDRWWTAHVQHLYQQLARRWQGHIWVTLAYVGWTLVAMGLAWRLRQNEWAVIMYATLAWYVIGALTWKFVGRDAHGN